MLITGQEELVAVYVGTVHVRQGGCFPTGCTRGCCHQLPLMCWSTCTSQSGMRGQLWFGNAPDVLARAGQYDLWLMMSSMT